MGQRCGHATRLDSSLQLVRFSNMITSFSLSIRDHDYFLTHDLSLTRTWHLEPWEALKDVDW